MNKKHQEFFLKLSELIKEYDCEIYEDLGAIKVSFDLYPGVKLYNINGTMAIKELAVGVDRNE